VPFFGTSCGPSWVFRLLLSLLFALTACTATSKRMPATPEDVQAAAARLGFSIPAEHKSDYLELLKGTDRAVAALLAEPGEPFKLCITLDHRSSTPRRLSYTRRPRAIPSKERPPSYGSGELSQGMVVEVRDTGSAYRSARWSNSLRKGHRRRRGSSAEVRHRCLRKLRS
jgi:hypothetical protein